MVEGVPPASESSLIAGLMISCSSFPFPLVVGLSDSMAIRGFDMLKSRLMQLKKMVAFNNHFLRDGLCYFLDRQIVRKIQHGCCR